MSNHRRYSSWKASCCCLQPFGETLSFHLIHLLTPLAAPDTFPSRKLRAPKKLHFMMFHFLARWDIFWSSIYPSLLLLCSMTTFIFPYSGSFAGCTKPQSYLFIQLLWLKISTAAWVAFPDSPEFSAGTSRGLAQSCD